MRSDQIALASLVALVFGSGCATPTVVQIRQAGDEKLSCAELKEQLAEADRFEREARKERGATGTNVAAALFFWPGLAATYMNTEEAINAAKERREHLLKIHKQRACE